MFINFETNDISERDARCLIALLEPIAGLEVKVPVKEAARHEGEEKPATIPQPEMTAPEIVETAKKRGRPRKDQSTEVAAANTIPAGSVATEGILPSSDIPASGGVAGADTDSKSDESFTLDDLREAVNDHVARKGMGSAMEIIKAAGCPRVTAVMDLELEHQQKVVAELKK